MKLVLAFAAGFLVAVGMSGRASDWATATVRSYHLERGKGYEEANYGLGFERHWSDWRRLSAGIYRNSERTSSAYIAWQACVARYGNWLLCGTAGGVTGYSNSVAPLAGAVLAYEGKEWGMNLILFPDKKGDPTRGVFGLQLKRRF